VFYFTYIRIGQEKTLEALAAQEEKMLEVQENARRLQNQSMDAVTDLRSQLERETSELLVSEREREKDGEILCVHFIFVLSFL
jgi:Mn-containing catalase